MSADPLPVVLCWHMHQPDYRDPLSGECLASWTCLHAIRSYTDMAAHLEAAPEDVRVVVNFSPILLEQIADYAARLRTFLEAGTPIGDPLLDALVAERLPDDPPSRRALLERCLHANHTRMIAALPAFERLATIARDR